MGRRARIKKFLMLSTTNMQKSASLKPTIDLSIQENQYQVRIQTQPTKQGMRLMAGLGKVQSSYLQRYLLHHCTLLCYWTSRSTDPLCNKSQQYIVLRDLNEQREMQMGIHDEPLLWKRTVWDNSCRTKGHCPFSGSWPRVCNLMIVSVAYR